MTLNTQTTVDRPTETRDEAILRLAREARTRGVQVFVYPPTGEHYATSLSQPGTLHRVTVLSCDCVGFVRHHRCSHHAALLDIIGELPVPPDPEPPAITKAFATPPAELAQVDVENRAAAQRYLDSDRGREARWELHCELQGEAYHETCGMKHAALIAWCEELVGAPRSAVVCGTCHGQGDFCDHYVDEPRVCRACGGHGVSGTMIVALEVEAVQHAA